MELIQHLGLGFSESLSPANLWFCFVGALIGTLIGVLPGVGPTATIAMLLPLTFSLPPTGALIMLAGIYYGAQYGGSTSAILIKLPGESSSVMTCVDGNAMARQGRAGPALAIAAIGSFFAGTVATLCLAVSAPPLARFAQSFGAAEYFSMMVLGLIGAVVLASGSVLKAVSMIFVGLLLGLVGTDVNSGAARFTFGIRELSDGIGFIPVAMGLFGIAEILKNLETPQDRSLLAARVTGLMPTLADLRAAWPAVLRGTALGSVLGVLPGGGATLSSFAAYTVEKKVSSDPSRFGQGAIEGVAAPESANNAAAQTSFIPLLTLGIPENAVMALMVGAMMIHGIQPGPQVISSRPELFWGMITSMWLGNLMLLVINLPLVGIWVRLLRIPYRLLFPAILVCCGFGVYSLNNTTSDILLTVMFGLLGYLFIKLNCEPAPLLLGFILGPMMEENLRRALLLSRGSFLTFVERPLSLVLLLIAVLLLIVMIVPAIRKKREIAFQEE